jgi:hypothetical protein
MADEAANGAEQSPESRLLGAGFTRRLEFWCPPGEERALNLSDAVAMLEAGEVQPELRAWPGVHPDALVGFQVSSEEEIDRMLHPPPAVSLRHCRAGRNRGRPRSSRCSRRSSAARFVRR